MRKHTYASLLFCPLSLLLCAQLSAAVIFNQDFSDGGIPTDYMSGGSASGSLFTAIGDDDGGGAGTGFTHSISGGALRQESDSSPSGDMGARFAGTGYGSSLISFTLNMDRTNGDFDFAPAGGFTIGNNSGTGNRNFSSGYSAASMFAEISIRATGATYQLENSGNGAVGNLSGMTYGNNIDFRIYLNDSGSSLNFTGPDSGSYSVSDQRFSLFYNDGGAGWTLGWNDILGRGPFLGNTPDIEGFNLSIGKENTIITLDNVSMTDAIPVPEPSTYALLIGLSALLITVLRRKKQRLS